MPVRLSLFFIISSFLKDQSRRCQKLLFAYQIAVKNVLFVIDMDYTEELGIPWLNQYEICYDIDKDSRRGDGDVVCLCGKCEVLL
ncbi:MAG: hypothetical protein U0103_21745 [Candidatus Obscuribacterales bacterium]